MNSKTVDAVFEASLEGFNPFAVEIEGVTFIYRPLTYNELNVVLDLETGDVIGSEELEECIVRRALIWPKANPSDETDAVFGQMSPGAPTILSGAITVSYTHLRAHET